MGVSIDLQRAAHEPMRYAQPQAFYADADVLRLQELYKVDLSIGKVLGRLNSASYYYIVLQLEGPNMESLLTSESSYPSLSSSEVLELICQLTGAASYMHKAGVIHNDINTDNIVQKREGGRYVIIDFGESGKSGSKGRRRRYSQYSPPDRDERLRGSFDVASLASVFAELLVWGFLGGSNVLLQFRRERGEEQLAYRQPESVIKKTEKFYVNTDPPKLSHSVERWLKKLEKVIPEIVAMLRKMLHPDPNQRPTAEEAFVWFTSALVQFKQLHHTRAFRQINPPPPPRHLP